MTAKHTKKQPSNSPDWQQQAETYLALAQRTQADFDNYRRRTEEREHELGALAIAQVALQLTPILDDFRRALQTVPPDEHENAWVTGIRQVEKRLRQLLAGYGLTPIEEAAQFNPHLHEAIATAAHPEIPEDMIIDVVEVGWKYHDKVLKPARVRVSSGQE